MGNQTCCAGARRSQRRRRVRNGGGGSQGESNDKIQALLKKKMRELEHPHSGSRRGRSASPGVRGAASRNDINPAVQDYLDRLNKRRGDS